MTKDNWIKAFEDEFGKEAQSTGMLDLYDFYDGGIYDEIKSFISQVEKDAIEKTNKRWREKIESSKYTFPATQSGWTTRNGTIKLDTISYNCALSDLLEDK